MTTVIIDFATKKVVADKQTTLTQCNYNMLAGTYKELDWTFGIKNKEKIKKLPNGSVFVAAGNVAEINRQYTNYTKKDYIAKPKGDCTIAVVYEKGDGLFVDLYIAVKTWKGYKWEKKYIQGNTKLITFGSGGDYAYGARMGGLTAEESLVAASKCDIYTSSDYDVVVVGE